MMLKFSPCLLQQCVDEQRAYDVDLMITYDWQSWVYLEGTSHSLSGKTFRNKHLR